MTQVVSANVVQEGKGQSLSRALLAGFVGGLIGAAVNIVILLIANGPLGIAMAVPMGPGGPLTPVGPVQVALLTIIPGVLAGLIFWAMTRFLGTKARGAFIVLSVAVLALSFIPTFSVPGIGADVRPVLAVMHLVAAVAIVGALIKK